MKRLASVLVLLGVFWAQTSALDTFVLRQPGSNYVTGTMTIHSEEHVVDVHIRSGVYSSDTIFDYSHGYIATRLFSRNACFIMKIQKEYIPELREIGRLAFERQMMRDVYSPNNVWTQFQSGNSVLGRWKDWILYGKHIEQLCTGLPLYQLVATAPQCPPLNGQIAYVLHSERKPQVVILSYDPPVDLCLVESL
ncbi:gastrokine-2-like [Empidonax traillii]|uniref:gastrokine-2-like n=1 Tax=Empidonax traillii TaxID=164674 RepID=UPI000FFD8AC7|nr:gastrokine-2-like [Empidonax traillii]